MNRLASVAVSTVLAVCPLQVLPGAAEHPNSFQALAEPVPENPHVSNDPEHPRIFKFPQFVRQGPLMVRKMFYPTGGSDCRRVKIDAWFDNGGVSIALFELANDSDAWSQTTTKSGIAAVVGTGKCRIRVRIERDE